MSETIQIRINELARELEVKAKAIIDYLPEAGVTEKKTHSSSIELDAAEKVRKHFHEVADAEAAAERAAGAPAAAKPAVVPPAGKPAPATGHPPVPAAAKLGPAAPSGIPRHATSPAPSSGATATRPAGPPVPPGKRAGVPATMRPAAQGAPSRAAHPGPPGATPTSRYPQRAGAPAGAGRPMPARPGQPMPGRPGTRPMRPGQLPPPLPTKAEPGKPIYARKPAPRARPLVDKRELEGERKLHPVRTRPGVGERRPGQAAAVVIPVPREPREVTITEGVTVRDLAEKLDIRAKDVLKILLDRGVFASINQALDTPTATSLAEAFNGIVKVIS